MFGVFIMMMSPSFYRTIHKESRPLAGVRMPANPSARKQLFRLTVIAALAALLFTSFWLITTNAAGETARPAEADEKVVVVTSGDTLWEIAGANSDGHEDIRKLVFLIKKRNQLDTAAITPGQTLIIPNR